MRNWRRAKFCGLSALWTSLGAGLGPAPAGGGQGISNPTKNRTGRQSACLGTGRCSCASNYG